jgi:hypothetical protein
MKPYYYVYRYGSNPPQIRHITLRAARNEAMRLAEQHPGAHFEILKFVGWRFASETKASLFWADGITPEDTESP